MGASPRRALQRLGEHFFDFLVVDTPRSSTARRVGKGFKKFSGQKAELTDLFHRSAVLSSVLRHLPTVGKETLSRRAITVLDNPPKRQE